MSSATDTPAATDFNGNGTWAAMACDTEIPPGPPTAWPGKQLTDIRAYNECCFRKCREKNPNGFYDDACGRACLCAVRSRERQNGWNPCEHRLQPPVFWYEPFGLFHVRAPSEERRRSTPNHALSWMVALVLLLFVVVTLFLVFSVAPEKKR